MSAAGSIGGAIWAVAKFIIPKIVEAQIESARDWREYRQQQQLEEFESIRQDRATRELRQVQMENQALAIAKENIQWAREDFSVMQKTMEQQVRVLEQIRENIRILAGEVARLADELKRNEE